MNTLLLMSDRYCECEAALPAGFRFFVCGACSPKFGFDLALV